jgi:broad specificity phosphatase PhoE
VSDCVWLLRHGDTEWTERELHTGARNVPLSDAGREQARIAGAVLASRTFDHVLVSPQSRALETSELAGFGADARLTVELVEWDYGQYEGLTDEQVRERDPDWDLFRDGAPGGESPGQVQDRVDAALARIAKLGGVCLVVGHGKLLRALAARWLGRGIELGSTLAMDPAAISLLQRAPAGPLLRLWNYSSLVLPAG